MKRNEIEEKYKWHLEDIVGSDENWETLYAECEKLTGEISAYQGKLDKCESLLSCLKLSSRIGKLFEKVFCYARMKKDEDASVDKYVAMTDRATSLLTKISTSTAFINSELANLENYQLMEFISDPDFSDYDFFLKEIMRTKEHILSEKEERLLAMDSSGGMFQEIFTMINNMDLDFPTIKVDGEKVKLTHGQYSVLLSHKDQRVRKAAFEGVYSAYKKLINTIAATYAGSVKKDNFYAKAKGFDNCLQKSMYEDDVPIEVYKKLIKSVNKNLKYVHRYISLRKKALKLNTMHMYDMHVPIVKDAEIAVPYEQAFDMVLEGLKPLGEEYNGLLKQARDQGWIDVMENEGKRSGAYSWAAYGTHPYVLLNYAQTTFDVFTIAHELGHAMHTYYSFKNQVYDKAGYQIFVAEVASTVNEVLLLKHMISSTKDKDLKVYLLSYYLDMFRTTLFRQAMFAEFELKAHDMELNGEPLTVKSLSDCYYELNKKYYGRSVRHDDDIRYEWARVPHFYSAFYVYKYATGITSAVSIVLDLLKNPDSINRYKRFLSSGGSKSPYEILVDAGVDLATSAPYEAVMKEFGDTLEMLEKELLN